jgi:aspartate/methionine/tyrosine aminotransferase
MNKVTIERSHRLDGIGEYYFSRKLREISEIEAATGRQIIRLAMGSPDLPPHQSVIDRLAKEAQRPDVHKYMSYQGEPILRKAFADWYKRYYNVDVDFKSEVLPLLGSKEGLMHICQTFLNVGDKVLVPNPGYPTYSAAVKLSGGVMVPYSLNKQTGFELINAAVVVPMVKFDYKARLQATQGYWPIPQTEIDLSNGVLEQNPGWEPTAMYVDWEKM